METVPGEVKELQEKLRDPNIDGFSKMNHRQQLMDIQKNAADKALRKYIDTILKSCG